MSKKDEFIKELHDLLEKYNAEISIGLDGDTHGLDSWMDIEFRDGDSFRYENVLKVDELNKYTLKKHLPK